MSKETIDVALAIVQIAMLIALILYVIKTWQIASASKRSTEVSEKILKEMKESRDQEVAPYVVTYFDIPYGKHWIYLVVRNVGKSVAKNVKLEFQPSLKNTEGEEINDIPLIKEGTASIPPGYKIRTFFDSAISYFNKRELPLTYKVKVSYSGGLRADMRSTEQIMDLYAFKGLSFLDEKGVHELVKEVEKLVKYNNGMKQELKKVADSLASGIWLKNLEVLTTGLLLEPEVWKSSALSKLIEFKTLWMSVYGGAREKLWGQFLADFKNRSAIIASQIRIIACSAPTNISSELTGGLVVIAAKLSELARAHFPPDGGKSVDAFDTLGAKIISLIDETIGQIELHREGS
ncbi:MAG: hypothetical protein KAW02_02595 [candidate division Zixibacteria bacterium]|nr:hypothetical protein [candidate division Zixibacteria bacterium]